MNQRIVKNVVISLSFVCLVSLWYVDRCARELASMASNHLELISQISQISANANQMLAELTNMNDLVFANNEQTKLIEKHTKLVEETRTIFDSLPLLDPHIERRALKLRKIFEKINIEWLNAKRDQIDFSAEVGQRRSAEIQRLYSNLNKGMASLSDIAIGDIHKAIKKIKMTITDLERLMITIQLFAIAIMLGLFSFPIQKFFPKKPF